MNIEIAAHLTGAAGQGWKLEYEDLPPDKVATLGTWFFNCPGQSVAWRHYIFGVVHLRAEANVHAAIKHFPEATHEFMIVALDPETNPRVNDPGTWMFLSPWNLIHQVWVPHDRAAIDILDLAAAKVVSGHLWIEPPLSGQTEPWRTMLTETAAHYRGKHGLN